MTLFVQVQVPRGRLFAFDSEGQHVLTCSSTGGLIYRVKSPPTSLQHCLNVVIVLCVCFFYSSPPPLHHSPADQWGAGAGQRAVTGRTQSPRGDGGLVLGRGLRDVSDCVHGWEDQTEHAPGAEVLTGRTDSRDRSKLLNEMISHFGTAYSFCFVR